MTRRLTRATVHPQSQRKRTVPATAVRSSAPLYTPEEAAAYLRANRRSLERWRTTGEGPVFVKVGRRVAYRQIDLDDWVQEQLRSHTGDT